jgi:hypothetical protein
MKIIQEAKHGAHGLGAQLAKVGDVPVPDS